MSSLVYPRADAPLAKVAAVAVLGLASACLALAPATASADIYMWTDEQGGTVISDERPENPRAVKNFKVLVKESERGPRTEVRVSRPEPTREEQALLERIETLERELREERSSQPDLPPANTYSSGYYAAPPLAPPAVVYDSGYYAPPYYVPPAYIVLGSTAFVSRPFGFGHKHFGQKHSGQKHFGQRHFDRGHPQFNNDGRGFRSRGFTASPRSSFGAGRGGMRRR